MDPAGELVSPTGELCSVDSRVGSDTGARTIHMEG